MFSTNNFHLVKWEKPIAEWVKLNVDATLDSNSFKMGFGFVLCKENEDFVAEKGVPFNGLFTPKEAEAIGVREALSWLKGHNVDSVIVEIDSLKLFNDIRHGMDDCSLDYW